MKNQLEKTKVVASSTPPPNGVKLKLSTEFSWIVRDVYESLSAYDQQSADRYLAMHEER